MSPKAPIPQLSVNAHIHLPPNFSAFDSVDQALSLAAAQRIEVLGVSNYYDYSVYESFTEGARSAGIFPLYGTEIIALDAEMVRNGTKVNDPGNPGKIYLCGKGLARYGCPTARATELLAKIRANDSERMAAMMDKLSAILAERGAPIGLSAEDAIAMVERRHGSPRATIVLQERHLCQAAQEKLFADHSDPEERLIAASKALGSPPEEAPANPVAFQNAIRSKLLKSGKPAFVEETFVTLDEARELILELGGIPCYPTLADGTNPITPFEGPVSSLIDNLMRLGIHCAEFIPIRNSPELIEQYVPALRAEGIVVTAGTEHNTLDLIPLTPACKGGAPIPKRARSIFEEGARVVAAHQDAVARGKVGYLTSDGLPNPDYGSAESRIAEFSRRGAALFSRKD